jgi:putative phosphoesterase
MTDTATTANGGTGGVRIGVIADSHSDICDWPALLTKLRTIFDGVDLILHCGDITTTEALDDLETIAPVRATRSPNDPPPDAPRLVDGPATIDVRGHSVVLDFPRPDPSSVAAAAVGGDVAAVIYGSTHASSVETINGVLWVNPGSPALAEHTSVAIVTIPPKATPTATLTATADIITVD